MSIKRVKPASSSVPEAREDCTSWVLCTRLEIREFVPSQSKTVNSHCIIWEHDEDSHRLQCHTTHYLAACLSYRPWVIVRVARNGSSACCRRPNQVIPSREPQLRSNPSRPTSSPDHRLLDRSTHEERALDEVGQAPMAETVSLCDNT